MGQIQIAQAVPISIHALREEGDVQQNGTLYQQLQFLSTPSVRRATEVAPPELGIIPISIHALREEGDICVGGLV